MKAFIVVALLAVAAFAQTDILMLKEAASHDIEVPKDDYYYLKYNITKELAQMTTGGPDINVHVTFRTTSVQRELHAFVGKDYGNSTGFIFNEDGEHTFDLAAIGFNCTEGCVVYIKLLAKCFYNSCVNSISTRTWARLVDHANNGFVYSNTKLPYMPLYLNKWSPVIEVPKGELRYFTYTNPEADGQIRCEKDASISSELTVVSGKGEITAPTDDNSKWFMSVDVAFKEFVNGDNYLGFFGTDKIVFTPEGRICIGTCGARDNFASALVPATFALLISAIVALF